MGRNVAVPAVLAILVSFSSFAGPSDIPNTIKYSDTGVKNATGRAGSASIEARALLNRDDSATVDVTTGSFEGGTAPGTIAKVQVKVPTGGDPVTKNFNDLDAGGTFSGNVGGVANGDTITVQANVRDIDPARTDVVTAQATVAKRPDLAVTAVVTPGAAIYDSIGRIRGVIRELNGEVGARANCRLLLNGVEVDRAENIWVNAGGTVQCAFAPLLEVEGRVDATIVVDAVNPADWDESNNSRTEPFTVYNVLDEFYGWSASASETQFDVYDYQKRSWTERTRTENGVRQRFTFNGAIRAPFDLANISMTAEGQSDGNPLFSVSEDDFILFNSPPRVGLTCARSRDFSPEVLACRPRDGGPVTVEISFGAADAIYRSWGWATRQNPFAPDGPIFYWNDTSEAHSIQSPIGSTVAMRFTIEDGTNHWTAEPFISSFTPGGFSSVSPYRCYFDSFAEETICRESRHVETTRTGSAMGSAGQ
ncbi:MAG TPA: hypothetical protein VF432_22075 [Thermoanaerobaculia bacterium]